MAHSTIRMDIGLGWRLFGQLALDEREWEIASGSHESVYLINERAQTACLERLRSNVKIPSSL